MGLMAETAAQRARLAGFKANLRTRGRVATVASLNAKDNGSEMKLLIDDIPMMADFDRPAQQQKPIYSIVSCLAETLADPRSVTAFTEQSTNRDYKVLEYLETAGDRISWRWRCEAVREQSE